MKSILIAGEGLLGKHVGEAYHDYIEIPMVMDVVSIHAWAGKIRSLILETISEDDKEVEVIIDGSPHHEVILVGLQDTMKADGVTIHLPTVQENEIVKDNMSKANH